VILQDMRTDSYGRGSTLQQHHFINTIEMQTSVSTAVKSSSSTC